jgi:hypothetical protein
MKKTILLLLAAVSPCATADWVLIFRYSDAAVYADPATVERVRDKATMWSVTDSRMDKDFLGVKYRSSMMLVEYDCARLTSREVKLMYYGGANGSGRAERHVAPGRRVFPGLSGASPATRYPCPGRVGNRMRKAIATANQQAELHRVSSLSSGRP